MTNSIKKDYIWNTLGTVVYSAVSVIVGILVIRIIGKVEGGLFTFGFTVLSQQVYSIAFFGVRTIHVVDVTRRYSFNILKIHRTITALCGFIFGAIYIIVLYLLGTYNIDKSIILLVIIFHGILEGFFEVYESEYQRIGKLYIAGISLLVRTVSWTLTFILFLIFTKDLLISVVFGMIIKFLAGYILDVLYSKRYFINEDKIKNENIRDALISLTLKVLPLFIIVFIDNYIYMSSKYAIDIYMGDVYSGYFSFLFMPATLIYLIDYMIIRPYLTPLGKAYISDMKEYKKMAKSIVVISIAVCIIYLILMMIFSGLYMYIINIVTGNMYVDIESGYKIYLFLNTLGGCFYVGFCPFYYYLIIENKEKELAILYIICAVISCIVSHLFVSRYGLMGASITFIVSMILLAIGIWCMQAIVMRKNNAK